MPHPRITIDPAIKSGKPVIAGTRVPVELLLKLLSKGWTYELILEQYPGLVREDILAAQAFAAEHLPRAAVDVEEAAK